MRLLLTLFAITATSLLATSSAQAALIDLSFAGNVDLSRARIGGVDAPIGSPFTLDIQIDDTNAAIGSYSITGVSYTTVLGTYTTSAAFGPITATQVGGGVRLFGAFQNNVPPGEDFFLNITNSGPSVFNDPTTWTASSFGGDIIVRGLPGGTNVSDHLSGVSPYRGRLNLSIETAAVPEPASIAIWSALGVAGLIGARRRRKNA